MELRWIMRDGEKILQYMEDRYVEEFGMRLVSGWKDVPLVDGNGE